jgi:hypothetical protein
MEHKLIDTRLEERDGAVWVTGLCPSCWERVAEHAPAEDSTATVRCPNGHVLVVVDQRSAGRDVLPRSCG